MLKQWLYAEPYKYSALRGQRFLFTCIFLICKLPIPESSRMEQQKLFFEFIASWHEKLHRIKITPFKKKKTLIPGINSFPLELKDFCKIDSMTVDRFFFFKQITFFFFFQKKNFFIFGQITRHPLISLFHLSNLLQMPNDHSMVDEFCSNFSCNFKSISFDDGSQLVIVNF